MSARLSSGSSSSLAWQCPRLPNGASRKPAIVTAQFQKWSTHDRAGASSSAAWSRLLSNLLPSRNDPQAFIPQAFPGLLLFANFITCYMAEIVHDERRLHCGLWIARRPLDTTLGLRSLGRGIDAAAAQGWFLSPVPSQGTPRDLL